jgi:hypothetical protein
MGGAKVGMGGALYCIDPKSKTSVAAIHHYQTKSEEEYNYKTCVRDRNNRIAKSRCGGTKPWVGEIFDDIAWQFLKNHVPKYAALTTSIPLML